MADLKQPNIIAGLLPGIGLLLMIALSLEPVRASVLQDTASIATHPAAIHGGVAQATASDASDYVMVADAFIRSVFTDGRTTDYGTASDRYIELISRWGETLSGDASSTLRRHVDQALLTVPQPRRAAIMEAERPGIALAGWWYEQDPLPASRLNERLVEHLHRVAHAMAEFSAPRTDLGFDDRGAVYVRLGPPSQRRQLDYFRPSIVQRIHELRTSSGNHLVVSPSSFASSEVWYYHGDEPYHFLFVSRGRQYFIGEVADIIPPHLRTAVDSDSGRGGAKADVVLEILRAIYEQLGSYHISYVQRLHEVDGLLSQLEVASTRDAHNPARDIGQAARRADYSAAMQRQGDQIAGLGTPAVAATAFVEAARHEDELVRNERSQREPQSRSSVLDGVEILRLGMQVARFLNRDGSTRAEIYWAPEEGALPLSPSLRAVAGARLNAYPDQVIQVSLVRNAGRADREVEQVHYHTVPRRVIGSVEPLPVQTLAADSLHAGDSFAVQWDQLLAAIGGEAVEVGATARLAVLRTEAFEPLHGDGRLEMSDLKPVIAATRDPYPFQVVEPTMPLALYFEVYGLTFGPDDQVDFRVDYEITLRREGGLLRRTREETTSGNLVSTIYGTRTEQYLILDPSRWGNAQEAEISIRVEDRSTGHHTSRSISFSVVDP